MTRIKFVDVPPFQDATKIEARLMATLRRLRDLPRQPVRAAWEDEDDSEPTEKGKTITYDDTKKVKRRAGLLADRQAAYAGHCCIPLTFEDSHRESMQLDGLDEHAITRPLSHNDLVQLHGFSVQARIVADLAGQGDDLARAAWRQSRSPCGVLRCGDPVLSDHRGPFQAAASANDRDGGQPAQDGGPGLGGSRLHHPVPTADRGRTVAPVAPRKPAEGWPSRSRIAAPKGR